MMMISPVLFKKPGKKLCKKILQTGRQCSFSCVSNNDYCKRHITKIDLIDVATSTESTLDFTNTFDASTNTEGTILDITTANKTVLVLIDELTEKEKELDELFKKYQILKVVISHKDFYIQNM